MRFDGRKADQLRSVKIELSPIMYPEGSVLIQMGNTHILCAVSIESGVPRWLRNGEHGWLTAEYALLPRSTQIRTSRNHIQQGRAQEIRRLIGRSLRQAVDLELLGKNTVIVDCDVLQADGGTRTASITGAYVAVALALKKLADVGEVSLKALKSPVAAISTGLVAGLPCLDLAYEEDSTAQIDLNVVMDAQERLIEIQGTAESEPVSRETVDELLDLAVVGIRELIRKQREALAWAGIER
ncbi:MAG: ribonuclease PH [Anaerolineae bacterium]|nr:ribonuclease PH [Anaerolineae bacterium]